MSRKELISYSELLEKVKSLLVPYPECCNIHIDRIEVYQEQNDGANWDVVGYRRSGDNNDLLECKSKITEEIRLLRALYDVAC